MKTTTTLQVIISAGIPRIVAAIMIVVVAEVFWDMDAEPPSYFTYDYDTDTKEPTIE